jgi:hypothetical protein
MRNDLFTKEAKGVDHPVARLAKDFENLAETPATLVILASIQLALRRFART